MALAIVRGESILVKNTLPEELKNETYKCKTITNKEEKHRGFAPFTTSIVKCNGLDYQGATFEFAVCDRKCINPVTNKTLPRKKYEVTEVWLTDYIGKTNSTKTIVTRPIACKCTKRKRGRKKHRGRKLRKH